MAMNPGDEMTQDLHSGADQAWLRLATTQLREHVEDRWVEIADRMLMNVLGHQRPSHPIRAKSLAGDFHVSEQVLVTALRHALDPVAHCEVTAIHVYADRDIYTGVTIVVTVQVPHPVIALADDVRRIAYEQLEQILGTSTPRLTVETMHVHVDDVSRGDPKRG